MLHTYAIAAKNCPFGELYIQCNPSQLASKIALVQRTSPHLFWDREPTIRVNRRIPLIPRSKRQPLYKRHKHVC